MKFFKKLLDFYATKILDNELIIFINTYLNVINFNYMALK